MTTTHDKKTLPRPPVVAVVGHVDHGKTTLLDHIRKENVAAGEAGGITQSIGAYEIIHIPRESLINADKKSAGMSADNQQKSAGNFPDGGRKVTFIDTPGHEAFSTMRAHGAAVADLAVLVIAADDGVKPQTKEAIGILKKTETPFVVAITKTDAPNANIEKVKNNLLSEGVLLEGFGGDVSWHEVSGKTGEGIDELLDIIILAGEVAGLEYDPDARAWGFVLESEKDKRRGNVAHIIIKNGVLRRGDDIVTKSVSGKVKILENFLGEPVKELSPSAPAAVCGFEDLPKSGEEFWAGEVDIEVVGVSGEDKEELLGVAKAIAGGGEEKQGKLKAILKADTAGSLEAVGRVLKDLVEVADASVGEISDNDVKFARSSESVVIGFNVKVPKAVGRLAEVQGVPIITSKIIYELAEAAESLEKKKQEEKTGGALEVLKVFSTTASKQTVGGKVVDGKITPGARAEILREDEIVGKGKVKSLQQDKADAKEVTVGNEAGLVVETETEIKEGDVLKISER